ncbi:MAG: DEAD/DEAH box helicase, partial [Blastocatellia bacterium]
LIVATQITVELDREFFPINRKSTQKEPQTWIGEIRRQNVPHSVLAALQRFVTREIDVTLRAKKAVACLLWITDKSLAEIEKTLTQFGGGSDSAAGPIRSVKARTCDFLPVVAGIAKILHPGLDLDERVSKLLTRLEVGVPSAAVELAALAGSRLARGDYQRLLKANQCTIAAIEQSSNEELLGSLNGDELKLAILRDAVRISRERQSEQTASSPVLPPYEA